MIVDFEKAVELILNEDIVALPTETVYGLAGDATSNKACSKIFQTKQRPLYNPLIIHVASLEEAKVYANFSEDAQKVASLLWPGPLTLILPKTQSNISDIATAGLDTIAIRIPSHEIMRSIITKTHKPLAAPSANIASRISPSLAEHVNKSFRGEVAVIDGGKTLYGIESTIVDFSTQEPTLLRFGFISEDIISGILEKAVNIGSSTTKINAPGQLKKHYSPSCPIIINATEASSREIAINFGSSNLVGAKSFNLSTAGDLIEAASNLYAILQQAEDLVKWENLEGIAIVPIPSYKIGLAINDKLERAAVK